MKLVTCCFVAILLFSLPVAGDAIQVDLLAGKSITTWHGQAAIQGVNIEFARTLTPRLELAGSLLPLSVDQPRSWFGDDYGDGNERVEAISIGIALRTHLLRDSSRVRLYLEGGSGPMLSRARVPASTSRFNFATRAGAGVVLRPASRVPIIVGYRFFHISNGGYSPRNPGLNVSSLVFGVRMQRR